MKQLLTKNIAAVALACVAFGMAINANASEESKINARIASWGRNCKNAVSEKFQDAAMSDITVSVGTTEQQSIDAGDTTLKDIKAYGLSFNWEVQTRYGIKNGYCNTDGRGNVTEVSN